MDDILVATIRNPGSTDDNHFDAIMEPYPKLVSDRALDALYHAMQGLIETIIKDNELEIKGNH
jgi:hypothetical protein